MTKLTKKQLKSKVTLSTRVTKDHIATGIAENNLSCPVARAINARLAAGLLTFVGRHDVDIKDSVTMKTIAIANLSASEYRRINKFDKAGGMRPHQLSLVFQPVGQ